MEKRAIACIEDVEREVRVEGMVAAVSHAAMQASLSAQEGISETRQDASSESRPEKPTAGPGMAKDASSCTADP